MLVMIPELGLEKNIKEVHLSSTNIISSVADICQCEKSMIMIGLGHLETSKKLEAARIQFTTSLAQIGGLLVI